MLGRSHFSLNLIPYNQVDKSPYRTPDTKQIDAFMSILQKERIVVTRRYSKGRGIAAACGQLALQSRESSLV